MDNFFKSPKIIIILALGLFTIFIGISISNLDRPAIDYRGPLSLWLSTWIDLPSCVPPCWENLTPGVSNFTEAQTAFSDREDIDNFHIGVGPLAKDQKILDWYFSDKGGDGQIYSDLKGEKIASIVLSTNPHNNKTLNLEEILLKFEEPDDITVIHCLPENGPICELRLLYPEIGIAFMFRSIPTYENSEEPFLDIDVDPKAEVTEIMFFPPGKSGYIEATSNRIRDDLERVQGWNGFGKYTFSY